MTPVETLHKLHSTIVNGALKKIVNEMMVSNKEILDTAEFDTLTHEEICVYALDKYLISSVKYGFIGSITLVDVYPYERNEDNKLDKQFLLNIRLWGKMQEHGIKEPLVAYLHNLPAMQEIVAMANVRFSGRVNLWNNLTFKYKEFKKAMDENAEKVAENMELIKLDVESILDVILREKSKNTLENLANTVWIPAIVRDFKRLGILSENCALPFYKSNYNQTFLTVKDIVAMTIVAYLYNEINNAFSNEIALDFSISLGYPFNVLSKEPFNVLSTEPLRNILRSDEIKMSESFIEIMDYLSVRYFSNNEFLKFILENLQHLKSEDVKKWNKMMANLSVSKTDAKVTIEDIVCNEKDNVSEKQEDTKFTGKLTYIDAEAEIDALKREIDYIKKNVTSSHDNANKNFEMYDEQLSILKNLSDNTEMLLSHLKEKTKVHDDAIVSINNALSVRTNVKAEITTLKQDMAYVKKSIAGSNRAANYEDLFESINAKLDEHDYCLNNILPELHKLSKQVSQSLCSQIDTDIKPNIDDQDAYAYLEDGYVAQLRNGNFYLIVCTELLSFTTKESLDNYDINLKYSGKEELDVVAIYKPDLEFVLTDLNRFDKFGSHEIIWERYSDDMMPVNECDCDLYKMIDHLHESSSNISDGDLNIIKRYGNYSVVSNINIITGRTIPWHSLGEDVLDAINNNPLLGYAYNNTLYGRNKMFLHTLYDLGRVRFIVNKHKNILQKYLENNKIEIYKKVSPYAYERIYDFIDSYSENNEYAIGDNIAH